MLQRGPTRPLKESSSRRSIAQWALLEEEDVAAYGPRIWVKPEARPLKRELLGNGGEDFKGAAKLVRWLEGYEVKAERIGISMEEEPNPEPVKAQPRVQSLSDARNSPRRSRRRFEFHMSRLALEDACAASLERIEKQMAQLLSTMADMAQSLKEAQSAAQSAPKKDLSQVVTSSAYL